MNPAHAGAGRRTGAALRVTRALRSLTNESEMYIATAGREAHMNRRDLSALALVMDRTAVGESTTPGQLSSALQLSAPATSAMLDRLEDLDHLRRVPHPQDRRSVLVEMTDHARAVGGAMFARLAAHMAPVLSSRSESELAAIAGFLEETAAATRAARTDIGVG
jgi:DNA-binding MarR family transcriptional regulator